MSSYYNMDDIRTSLVKEIAINKAYIAAWENVSFPVKKDGKPFANMSKNISGAKYALESYARQTGEYELTVYTQATMCGYIHDSIKAYKLVRYLKDESMKAKTENYQNKNSYLEQVYKFDLDDIKKAVSDRIEYLKSYVSDLEKQLESLETVFRNFRAAYDNAIKQLEKDTACFEHKNSFYAVKDTVLARYPYV